MTLGLTERFRDDDLGWAEYDLDGPCFGVEHVPPGDTEGEALVGRFVGVSLREKGVHFTAPPEKQHWGGSLAHFHDPDRNVLTLFG